MFGALSSSGANSEVSPTPVRSYVMFANGAGAGRPAVPDGDAVDGAAAVVPCAASGPAADASTPTTSAQYLLVIEEISSERVVKWHAPTGALLKLLPQMRG